MNSPRIRASNLHKPLRGAETREHPVIGKSEIIAKTHDGQPVYSADSALPPGAIAWKSVELGSASYACWYDTEETRAASRTHYATLEQTAKRLTRGELGAMMRIDPRGKTKSYLTEKIREIAKAHFRIDDATLDALLTKLADGPADKQRVRSEVTAFVDAQRARWKEEARIATALIEELPGDGGGA